MDEIEILLREVAPPVITPPAVLLLRRVVAAVQDPRACMTLTDDLAIGGQMSAMVMHGTILLLGSLKIEKPKGDGYLFLYPILHFIDQDSDDAEARVRKHVENGLVGRT